MSQTSRMTVTCIWTMLAAAFVADVSAVTIRPKATDEALINPGMGLVHYAYSSRIWAYDTGIEPGNTLDSLIPGTSVVYMRLPWSYLEPEEGVFRWDILDVKARQWIAAGKKLAFRVTVMDHTMNSIPDWAMNAGIKGEWHHYKNDPNRGKWFEPEWDDPVLLTKHEAFLMAFAKRWDGNPDVAFVDVGSFGAYGEGHGPHLNKLLHHDGNTNEVDRLARLHLDMARRCLPNTYLVVSDDVGGWTNPDPNCAIMAYARSLGIGLRDDSIFCVGTPPKCWAHEGWARQFAKTMPVVIETCHHVRLDKAGGGDAKIQKWFPEYILDNLIEYQASYYTVHSFPHHLIDTKHGQILKQLALRVGYRMELREVTFPERIKVGAPVAISSTWVNTGVAPMYAGAALTWNILDEKGTVVWSIVDSKFDFRSLEPTLRDGEKPRQVTTHGWCGYTATVPDNGNDDVLKWARAHPKFDPGSTVELLKPGRYTLAVSVGRADGKPEIALPLAGGKNRMYPLGTIDVVR